MRKLDKFVIISAALGDFLNSEQPELTSLVLRGVDVPCTGKKSLKSSTNLTKTSALKLCALDPECGFIRFDENSGDAANFESCEFTDRIFQNPPTGEKTLIIPPDRLPQKDGFTSVLNMLYACSKGHHVDFTDLTSGMDKCITYNCAFLSINPHSKVPLVTYCGPNDQVTEVAREGGLSFKYQTPHRSLRPQTQTILAPCGADGPIVGDDHHPIWEAGEIADPKLLP